MLSLSQLLLLCANFIDKQYNIYPVIQPMQPLQTDSRSHTLTNPHQPSKPLFTPSSSHQFQVKIQEDPNTPIHPHNQNIALRHRSTQQLIKHQIQQSSLEQQPEPLGHHKSQQKNDHHPWLTQQNSSTLLDDFPQDYILPGTDSQKSFIYLHIQQILSKPNIHLNSDHLSEHQFPQPNSIKMQIQQPNSIQRPNNPQVQAVVHNQPHSDEPMINVRQIKFCLTDAKEKRQLRRLTPIKSLKKYILQKFGYSSGAHNCQYLQLFFSNLHPNQSPLITLPITNEQNLELILSEYLKARKDISITFENDGTLKKKIQRKPKPNEAYQVQFDSDGELQDEELSSEENSNQEQEHEFNQIKLIKKMIMVNKTQKSRYRGLNLVRCAFCQKANKDIESIKICGPFYGPFIQRTKKTKHYCHLLCALWCKKVFLNDKNELEKIPLEIVRSQKKMCEYCDNYGAGLLCMGCNAAMHYECGLDKCQYLWATYELYCLKCKESQQNQEMEIQGQKNQEKEEESQINQGQINQDESINRTANNIVGEFHPDNRIKFQVIQPVLQIQNVMNINTGGLSSQDSGSRTESIPHQKNRQNERNKLMIDPNSRLQINGEQESQSVEVLEEMCRPARHKQVFPSVKLEEKLLASNQKPRRGRRPNPKKGK